MKIATAMAGPRIGDSEVLAAAVAVEELADEATAGLAEAAAAAEVATEEVSGAEVRTIRARVKREPGPSSATLSNPRHRPTQILVRLHRPQHLRRNPKVV